MNARMNKAIVVSILTSVALFFFTATVSAQTESLLLVGPISKVKDESLQMLGQAVILDTGDAEDVAAKIESDSYIAVFGNISKKGQLIATRIDVLEAQYVPGASPVMVSGLVAHTPDKNGRVTLGELTMDATSSISNGPDIHSEGLVVCAGVQPNPDGIMLEYTNAGFDSYESFANFQNSNSGEFLASVESGTTPFSIDGSGGYSIDGSGGFSIDGSGGVSIDGSGGVSIDGRGKKFDVDDD